MNKDKNKAKKRPGMAHLQKDYLSLFRTGLWANDLQRPFRHRLRHRRRRRRRR